MSKQVIFVFGSNLAGRHGAGSALAALTKWGAIYGQGEGLQGRSYAIPTKDRDLHRLHLAQIERYVKKFLSFARENPNYHFYICAIGTGLAGYEHSQIAPFFKGATSNCMLPTEWWRLYADL